MLFKGASIFSKLMTIVVSIVFIALGLLFFIKFDPSVYDMKTFGTITNIEERYESIGGDNELMCTAYIDYTVGDVEFRNVPFPSYNSGMKIGDKVEFYYMSENPTNITGTDKDTARYFGLAFAGIGLVVLVISIIRSIRGKG